MHRRPLERHLKCFERIKTDLSIIYCTELKNYKRTVIRKETGIDDFKWQAEDWNECPVSCGGGQRNRKTYCTDKNKSKVDESLCKGIMKFCRK